ncbi:MAG TPA: hypothetical protein VNA13_01010, partial [Xanthomonadales bacterium]|nr:hypothetical protein [Xanthomonadales bacterium]
MALTWHEADRTGHLVSIKPPLRETGATIIDFPPRHQIELAPKTPQEHIEAFRNFVGGLEEGSIEEEAAKDYFALMVE